MAVASTYRPPLTTRQLLISVQNADEAELAFQCGVPWVDLKNPAAGALGQPDSKTCNEFITVARQHRSNQISCAFGEFNSVDWDWASQQLTGFSIGKVGFAGLPDLTERVTSQLSNHAGRIVPALYADWQRAGSAGPTDVIELAKTIRAPFLLIDTYVKDGRGLFDWLSVAELKEIQSQVHSFDAELVLAGSLRTSDWAKLEQLDNITIGVRGAVCASTADRASKLCPEAVEQWLQWTGHPT